MANAEPNICFCWCTLPPLPAKFQSLLQVGPKAQGTAHVIISQAALLLELMRSTLALTSQPAGSLVACTTILSKMTACQVGLDSDGPIF